MARTADFRDINKNGIDDRDEGSESREGASTTQRGKLMYDNMMKSIMGRSEDPDDTLGRDLKMGYAYNVLGKGFDYGLTKGMTEFQSGIVKDNTLFNADLELRNQRDARADEFGYGMRAMDKQFELQDEYQNREYGRNMGYMQATGEQTRKNYRSQGVEDRLSRITQGEQDRLNTAAVGDQARKNYDFEDRVNARGEKRDQDRSSALARGF
tara:strand:+ start:121 stop:753 length:633 start_codon:yes stop_codon:yes gene_type:complete